MYFENKIAIRLKGVFPVEKGSIVKKNVLLLKGRSSKREFFAIRVLNDLNNIQGKGK